MPLPALAAGAAGLVTVISVGVGAGTVLAPLAAGGAALLVRWLQTRPVRASPVARADLPLVLDLIAAALRAGASVPAALACAGAGAAAPVGPTLTRVAALLRLGATPGEAWAAVASGSASVATATPSASAATASAASAAAAAPADIDPSLRPVARLSIRSAHSGVRLADALERHAAEVRADLQAEVTARAQRVAVFGLLPLGLCFLPAFICLGVIPIVAGVAGDALGTAMP